MSDLILWNTMNRHATYTRQVACYQLASWLRFHGYSVKVIDFCSMMSTDDLVSITEKYIDKNTKAIGVSSTFWNNNGFQTPGHVHYEPQWVINARSILESKYNLSWLVGGPAVARQELRLKWVEFLGSGEDSLLKWMDENTSKLIRRNLFDIKLLNKTFMEDDFIRSFEVLPIELGRGCQFKCRFCSYPGIGKKKGTYIRNILPLKEEILTNYNMYGITKYYFLDDTVNESEEKINEIADMVQALPFKLEWIGYNRLDLIWSRPGTIQTLKDSGLKSSFFGIESFNPIASMAVGKGWNGRHGKDFLLELKDNWKDQITWYLGFIIGLPGEDRNSILESYNWCVDNKMYDWGFFSLYINCSEKQQSRSEFDVNYKDYGYTFCDNDNLNWKNDLWTKQETVEFSEELRIEGRKHRRLAAWELGNITGMNYPHDINTPVNLLPWDDYARTSKKLVNEYVKFQLTY